MNPAAGAAVVLMYHRVARAPRDPFWLCVDPEHFAEHLEVLNRIADLVPLRNIFDRAPRRRVAITFDDGYRDNLDVALPLLRAARAPATVFVSSDLISGTRQGFWWDRLEQLLLDAAPGQSDLVIDTGLQQVPVELASGEGRERALHDVQKHVRGLPVERIEQVIARIAEQLTDRGRASDLPATLDAAGVRELARSGLVEIGGHTRSHSMLSSLQLSEQWTEISGCRRALEDAIEQPVTTFAYPFGHRQSFNRRTVRLVKKAGFELACSTSRGPVRRWTNRFRLPRVQVADWSGDEFARHLTRSLRVAS